MGVGVPKVSLAWPKRRRGRKSIQGVLTDFRWVLDGPWVNPGGGACVVGFSKKSGLLGLGLGGNSVPGRRDHNFKERSARF